MNYSLEKKVKMSWDNKISYLKSYAIHYTVVLLCGVLFLLSEFHLSPRLENAKFQITNKNISKSYVEDEWISGPQCVILSGLVAFGIIVWYCLFSKSSLRKLHGGWQSDKPDTITKDLHFFHVTLLCLAMVFTVTGAATNSLKLLISNFRPDFIDRCQPNAALIEDTSKYYNIDICQQPNKAILYEGLKSTPSGHSSFITAGLGFIFLWQSRFILGHYVRHMWCPFIIAIVMISRITDHRHHWYDVISGCLLGVLVIFGCWKWVFYSKSKQMILLP